MDRTLHKEYTCEIWKSYLLLLWPRLNFLFKDNNENNKNDAVADNYDTRAMKIVLLTFVTAN